MCPKENFNKTVLALGLVLTFAFGFSVAIHSWDSFVYSFKEGTHRTPAATPGVFDFSHIQSSSLKMASQRRLLQEASIEKSNYGIGLSLGHFTLRGLKSKKVFACHMYDRVEMKFRANDISVSGRPSLMVVESDCRVDKDIHKISTIWIPLSKIVYREPSDMSLTFTDKQPISLKMENISDSWPRDWSLTSIRFFNSEIPTQQLNFDWEKLRSFTDKPVSFTWYGE